MLIPSGAPHPFRDTAVPPAACWPHTAPAVANRCRVNSPDWCRALPSGRTRRPCSSRSTTQRPRGRSRPGRRAGGRRRRGGPGRPDRALRRGRGPRRLREALAGWEPGAARGRADLVEIPVTYDGADLASSPSTGGCPRRTWSARTPRSSSSRRSAGSRRASPTWRDCRRSAACRGSTRPGRGCRPGPSPWPAPGRRLPDGVSRRVAAHRPHRRRALGRRADEPALLPPGTRVRFVPR